MNESEIQEKLSAILENRTLVDLFQKQIERVQEELLNRDLSTIPVPELVEILVNNTLSNDQQERVLKEFSKRDLATVPIGKLIDMLVKLTSASRTLG
jgi:hypothetical protein